MIYFNRMKLISILFLSIAVLAISCNDNLKDYAINWSDDIKSKIMEDASKAPDSVKIEYVNDSTQIITFLRKDTILRRVRYNSLFKDTVASIYFSGNSKFVLGVKYCKSRRVYEESISYKDIIPIGFHKTFYCNGVLKSEGFSFKGPVGKWNEYDSLGNLIQTVDHGNFNKLKELKTIRYYR